MKWYGTALLSVALMSAAMGCDSQTEDAAPPPNPSWDLRFTYDPGIRIDNASNPAARLEGSRILLFYHREGQPTTLYSESTDGLVFTNEKPALGLHHPYDLRLPDGRYRRYKFDYNRLVVVSETSTDGGATFQGDMVDRYLLDPSDNGTFGIHDEFVDSQGGVEMYYIGDLNGLNNVRRAYSTDGGDSFQFAKGNALGDSADGGGSNSFVDQHSIPIEGGRRRMTTMRGGTPGSPGSGGTGEIWSFLSTDDGKSFEREPGPLFDHTSVTDQEVLSLHDPTMVRLPDGRYRIYVAARVEGPTGSTKTVLLSFTSDPPPTATVTPTATARSTPGVSVPASSTGTLVPLLFFAGFAVSRTPTAA